MTEYREPSRKAKLIPTTFCELKPFTDPNKELAAAKTLFNPELLQIIESGIRNSDITVKEVNGSPIPSILMHEDGEQAIAIARQMGQRFGPFSLEHGPSTTLSTEAGAIFRQRSKKGTLTLATEPGIGDYGRSGLSYLAGDSYQSTHPMLSQSMENMIVATFPITTEELLENAPFALIGARTIAPTPGTVSGFLDTVSPHIIPHGTIGLVLSTVRTTNPRAAADRNKDIEAIEKYVGMGYKCRKLIIQTNALADFQKGNLEGYTPEEQQIMREIGPYDSRLMSIGVTPDTQIPPPEVQFITLRKPNFFNQLVSQALGYFMK